MKRTKHSDPAGHPLSRRTLLTGAATSLAAATIGLPLASCGQRGHHEGSSGDAWAMVNDNPRQADPNFRPDLDIELAATTANVPLRPGAATAVWRYQATLISGDPGGVTAIPGSYLGPIITAWTGQKVRVRLVNHLPEPTILHWHGLRVPDHADGHPRLAIRPGDQYVYEFTLIDPAGTYWFHPHTHSVTGAQVMRGLAGLFIVRDQSEASLGLPSGARDIPLVIQDRTFTASNQFVLEESGHHTGGFQGDTILVNGQPDASIAVEGGVARLRLVNGAHARVFKLAFDTNLPLTLIGTDGGLLVSPVTLPYVTLSPGERADLWVDFSQAANGSLRLVSLPFDSSAFEGMIGGGNGGGMGGNGGGNGGGMGPHMLSMGQRFTVARFDVGAKGASAPLPRSLGGDRFERSAEASRVRRFTLGMAHGAFTINGRLFEPGVVAEDDRAAFGALEIWEFDNRQGHAMAHPMHIHGVRFQVIERRHDGSQGGSYADLKAGFSDAGWKDTVLVMPGEVARLLVRYDGYRGLFLYHCHNLSHHDQGMMRNFRIE